MNKLTDYTVVTGASATLLAYSVNQMLDQGWVPQGGVSVYRSGSETAFFEAMVKYAE